MLENLRDLAIIIAAAEVMGLIAKKIKLPQVVGQIIAGLIIGPCLLNWSNNTDYIKVFAEVGVILLMFSAGLETNLKTLIKTGPVALLMAVMGVFVPLVLGTILTAVFYGWDGFGTVTFYKSVFIGVIMTATSVGITVQTLKELGKLKTELGTTIVSAAIIDDVIGIIVLTVVMGIAGGGDTGIGEIILKTVTFFLLAVVVGYFLYKIFSFLDKRYPHMRRIPIFSIALCFALAYVAEEYFGIADITGAYVAGVILCNIKDANYVDRKVNISSYMFFGPIFFASIGLKTNISGMTWGLFAFSLSFVAVALLAKIIGCGIAAKLTKHTWKESLICGIGMMTRGEVALIVTQKGLDAGLISSDEFTPVILLIIFSSVLVPILLKLLFKSKKGLSETKMAEIGNND
ncbi:MAG: cation:proton antiporter [Butyrivibrio sp.]|nr:cation:proton antiporter [Butyrivibrio sp.]